MDVASGVTNGISDQLFACLDDVKYFCEIMQTTDERCIQMQSEVKQVVFLSFIIHSEC